MGVSLVYAFLHYALMVACEPILAYTRLYPAILLGLAHYCLLRLQFSLHAVKLASSQHPSPPADITRAGETISEISGLPLPAGDAAFAFAFAGLCYFASPPVLDQSNAVLVAAVVASFLVRCALPC